MNPNFKYKSHFHHFSIQLRKQATLDQEYNDLIHQTYILKRIQLLIQEHQFRNNFLIHQNSIHLDIDELSLEDSRMLQQYQGLVHQCMKLDLELEQLLER